MTVELNKRNTDVLTSFFNSEFVELFVNDVVENAFCDFLVFIENVDAEKFQKYYEELVK